MNVFYGELAPWWPLISPVEEYADEAAPLLAILSDRRPEARTLLELGSGGGHVANHLARRFDCTLTDLSPAMLAMSAALNPDCAHVQGDMRTLALGRTFDVVFGHDALDYMRTEADLRAVCATARRHLGPGGLALFIPDHVAERYAPSTEAGGSDGPDGRAARYLEWNEPASAEGAVTHYTFVLREADGSIHTRTERHAFGLFPEATWVRLLREAGFDVEVLDEPDADEEGRRIFLASVPLG